MNMMARGLPDGSLVDPYGGSADVERRLVDVLRPQASVEDPLRMLRACQFAARFGFAVTPRTLDAMRESAHLIATVSAERVTNPARQTARAGRKSPRSGWKSCARPVFWR